MRKYLTGMGVLQFVLLGVLMVFVVSASLIEASLASEHDTTAVTQEPGSSDIVAVKKVTVNQAALENTTATSDLQPGRTSGWRPQLVISSVPEIRIEPTDLNLVGSAPATTLASPGGRPNSAAGPDTLFTFVGPPETVNLPSHAVRAQPVIVNQRALRSSSISIELFGETYTALQKSVDMQQGQLVWVGHLQGQVFDTVIVTARGNSFSALIQESGRTFELALGASGRSRLIEIDLGQLPPDDPYVLPDGGGVVSGQSDFAAPAAENVIQDLLAVYTQSACDVAVSCEQVVTNIITAVADMNAAYQASGINITMNLVGTLWTDYAGTDFSITLSDLTGETDGSMDEVHAVRDQLGADVVALVFGGDGKYCGLGWVNSSESSAFSVTASDCVVSNRSFAHEIGHNQGALHDRVTAGAANSTNYNYGFRRCSDGSAEDLGSPYFRTIMAYNCASAARVGIYSNPDINYLEVPQGVDPLVVLAGGAHNARTLNESATTVADFRASMSAGSFTIFNDGGGDLSITSIETESPADWITWSPAAPFTVPPGSSREVSLEVDFVNAPSGVSNNRLLVYSNDTDENPYPNAVNVTIERSEGTCFAFASGHNGQGLDPVAVPDRSDGCPADEYMAGENISLTANPDPGWLIESWSGTNDDASISTSNTLTMPAGARAVTVNYAQDIVCTDDAFESVGFENTDDTCYGADLDVLPASRTHLHCDVDWVSFEAQAGVAYVVETANLVNGSDTTLSLHQDCGAEVAFDDDGGSEQYSSRIAFTAQVSGWYDVQVRQFNDAYLDGEGYDILVSPNLNCYVLTLNYSGSGAAPTAAPDSSPECAIGTYLPGEVISLAANPAADWMVGSWSGTDNDDSIAPGNTVTMADADRAVVVNYIEGNPAPEVRIDSTSLDFTDAVADALDTPVGEFTGTAEFTRLLDKAKATGSIKVILGLDVPARAEGALNAVQKANQRARIQRAQDNFLARLALAPGQARKFQSIPYLAFEAGAGQLNRISAMRDVVSIQEDVLARPSLASSNPVIGAPAAWAQGYDGTGFAVAVLDTGVDKTHPFFSTGTNKVISEACYSTNFEGNSATSVCPGGLEATTATGSGGPCDMSLDGGCAHGTHVAGIAAGNDGTGPDYGVARGADIVAIQVFSMFDDVDICSPSEPPCILTYSSDQISGLERILELSATMDIAAANMSLGGGNYTDQASCDTGNAATKAAIDNLRSVGIATVIASGNEYNTDAMGGPACISSAVSVGSTTDADDISSFSNVTDFLDLLAPGSFITSAVPGGGTQSWNGTSMATPHVAGAWAVLKQKNPDASVDMLLAALRDTGTGVDDQRENGSVTDLRRINLDTALLQLESGNSRIFTIFNEGSADLEVTSLDLESPAAWISWSVVAPFIIPPGESRLVNVMVDFSGVPDGASQNRLLVYTNDEDENPYPDAVMINVITTQTGFIFSSGFE